MKTSPNLKALLSLAAIFFLGAASGSLVTARLRATPEVAQARTAPEERWQALTLADYQQRLSLTPEQVEKLKPVFGVTSRKLSTLRANTADRISALIHEMNGEVMKELLPRQQEQLKTLLEERRKQAKSP
jgi:Spy/CpxP family protein refolding chaperone